MARVTLSGIISDIRGKLGTVIFSVWKGVHTVRSIPINFQYNWKSAKADTYRQGIDLLAYEWTQILTTAQKDLWETYATFIGTLGGLYVPGTVQMMPGLEGYRGVLSGKDAFVLTNQLRRSVGYATILDDAPLGEWFPPQPNFLTFDYEYIPPVKLKVTLTPLAPGALDFWLVCWCRGKGKSFLAIAKCLRGENVGQTDWNTAQYPKGVTYDILPDDYQCQLIYITSKGTFSPFTNVKEIKVPSGFPSKLWDSWIWDTYIWN